MKVLGPAFLLIIVAGVVYADEPDFGQLKAIGTQAAPARDAWERCTASVVRRELSSERAAEVIAEQALALCRAQEGRLRAALARRIGGKKARTVVMLLRTVHRESLASVLNELRRR